MDENVTSGASYGSGFSAPSQQSQNPFKRFFRFITSASYSRTIGALAILVIVAAVPLTVYIAQQRQNTQQHASGGTNLIASDMANATYDGTPGGAGQDIGPGTYTLDGDVSWTTVFPAGSGFQEIASLQVDEWNGSTYVTSYPQGDSRGTINNFPTAQDGAARSYHQHVTFTIPDGHKGVVLERASNTNAHWKNVILTNGEEIATNMVDPNRTNSNSDHTAAIGRNTDDANYDSPEKIRGKMFKMYGNTTGGAGGLDIAEWKFGSPAVWNGGHPVGEAFVVKPDTDFLQTAINVTNAGTTLSWTGARVVELKNVLRDDMKNRDILKGPAEKVSDWFGVGVAATYTLSGHVEWTYVFPPGSGFQEIASLQVDTYKADKSTYCNTFGPTREQSVVDPPQTASARKYDLSTTFNLSADCPYFKVIERNVNTKSTYSNVSLVLGAGDNNRPKGYLVYPEAPSTQCTAALPGTITGWACDTDAPTASTMIMDIHTDGQYVGQVSANQDLFDGPDLQSQCGHPGQKINHGYSYTIPDSLRDGKPHTLAIYAHNLDSAGTYVSGAQPNVTYEYNKLVAVLSNGQRQTNDTLNLTCPVPGGQPAATATTVPGATATTVPGATATTVPTGPSGSIQLTLDLGAPAIGNVGSLANPGLNSLSNKTPKPGVIKNVFVCLFPAIFTVLPTNTTCTGAVATKKADVQFAGASGTYKGTFDMGAVGAGTYQVYIKGDKYLRKRVPAPLTVVSGSTTPYPIPSINLTPGDINNDSVINVGDYNALIACWTAKPLASCSSPAASDLNEDTIIDQLDFNLFITSLATQFGD